MTLATEEPSMRPTPAILVPLLVPGPSTTAREMLMLSSIKLIMVVCQTIMTVKMEDAVVQKTINSTSLAHEVSTLTLTREMLMLDILKKSKVNSRILCRSH